MPISENSIQKDGDTLKERKTHQGSRGPFSSQPLSRRRARFYEIWDILAIIAALLSLLLIVLCWLYRVTPIPEGLQALSPTVNHYAHFFSTHENQIDLGFVTIFVIDIIAGWTCAIIEKRYYRWFFYPFVHWYDVLGSLPFAGFRWLRILRVIGLGVRLQNSGTIDVRTWQSYAFFHKYYDIVMEELSDRVASKLLTNAQEDINEGEGLVHKVVHQAVLPHQAPLVNLISQQVLDISHSIGKDHSPALEQYLIRTTREVMQKNSGVRTLNQLPFGKSITAMLESSLSDVVVQLVRETQQGIGSASFKKTVHQIVTDVFNKTLEHPDLKDEEFNQLLIESLQVIKDEVSIKRWKTRYADDT